METIIHPWGPVYDEKSKVLILGTIPSPKSREMNFFYGHPQNIFFKTLAQVLENGIALWDVLKSCEINGASDSSIRNPKPNDFSEILEKAPIEKIFTTGKKAKELYDTLCLPVNGREAIYLPSTSPANRAYHSKPEFMELWSLVKV